MFAVYHIESDGCPVGYLFPSLTRAEEFCASQRPYDVFQNIATAAEWDAIVDDWRGDFDPSAYRDDLADLSDLAPNPDPHTPITAE